jgi:hypothetical protein
MKAYSFKWDKKTNQYVFTDSGRHIIKFNSFEEQMNEMMKFFNRKDISIRIAFNDTEGKQQMRKVQFQRSSTLIKTKEEEFFYYCKDFQPKETDKAYTFCFPLNNVFTLYLWYERIHNGKCVVMYGRDRTFAKPIDHTKVRFNITYKNETAEV